MKTWQNTGEAIMGDDLNSNFAALAAGTEIAADSITPDKLLLGQNSSTVATEQSTTTTSYSHMTTTGPSVSHVAAGTQTVLIQFGADMTNSTNGNTSYVSPFITGATTLTATDANSANVRVTTTNGPYLTASKSMFATVNPGTNTIMLQYRVDGGSATIQRRFLNIIPLS